MVHCHRLVFSDNVNNQYENNITSTKRAGESRNKKECLRNHMENCVQPPSRISDWRQYRWGCVSANHIL